MVYRIVGLVTVVAWVALFGFVIWSLVNPPPSAEGTIVSVSRTRQNSECCPVTVEFRDDQGQLHTFSSPTGGDRQQEVGDQVTVYYNPEDPSTAQTADDRVMIQAIAGFGLLVLGLVSWSLFLTGKRKSQTESELANAAEWILDNKKGRLETKYQTLMVELAAVGHAPEVWADWAAGEGGGANVRLVCRICGRRRSRWLPESRQQLTPLHPCTG